VSNVSAPPRRVVWLSEGSDHVGHCAGIDRRWDDPALVAYSLDSEEGFRIAFLQTSGRGDPSLSGRPMVRIPLLGGLKRGMQVE
jgi:hypothetical protein